MNDLALASLAPDATFPDRRAGDRALLVLVSVVIFTQMDLALTSLLIEPIKRDLHLSDVQLGLIQGTGFGLGMVLGAVPLGILIDRASRVWLLRMALLIFVATMIAASLASGFLTLFVAEFTLGAVLSLINPAATSLLSDLFAPDQRSARTAILSAGQISGQAGAFLIGGIFVDYLAGHASGGAWYMSFSAWRITYLIFAVLSLVALPGLLTLPEPARQETAIRRLSIVRSFRHLVDYKAFLMPLFAGSTFGLVASSAILTWIAPILMRSYGLHAGQVGEWLSIVTLTGGLLASFLAGKLSRDAKQAGRSIVFPAAIACLVFAPFTLLALTPSAALVAGGLFMIVTTSILTQVTSSIAIVTLIPNELRGLCFGIYLVLGIGFGRGVGPEMVAWLGGLFAGPNGLNIALAVVSAPCSLVAAWLFLIASARSIGRHGRLG